MRESGDPGTKVAFIHEETTPDGERYTFLQPKNGFVKELYLYDHKRLEQFREKNHCDTLWHKCQKPTLEQIVHQAKLIKLSEQGMAIQPL
ncbi:MAG: hypothetical protein IE916_00460 [Epsilonproteobacteria bacterium]|nr:hypothetical protein [Campylobacterota bacterium]